MIKPVATPAVTRIDAPRASSASQAPKADKPAPAPSTDSAGAEALAVATQVAASGPPINPDKVAAIRAAIEEGRYSLDPDAIAARMIALDLPQLKAE